MAGNEVTYQHWPSRLGLDFEDAKLPLACSDHEVVGRDLDDRAWLEAARTRWVRDDSRATNDQTRAFEKRICVRPRIQPTHPVVNLRRWLRPVDQPFFFGQPWRVGRLRVVMRYLARGAHRHFIEDGEKQAGAELGERLLDDVAGLVWSDGSRHLGEH